MPIQIPDSYKINKPSDFLLDRVHPDWVERLWPNVPRKEKAKDGSFSLEEQEASGGDCRDGNKAQGIRSPSDS